MSSDYFDARHMVDLPISADASPMVKYDESYSTHHPADTSVSYDRLACVPKNDSAAAPLPVAHS